MHTHQDAAEPAQPQHNPGDEIKTFPGWFEQLDLHTPWNAALRAAETTLRRLEEEAPDFFGDADFAAKLEQARIDVHAAEEKQGRP